MKPIHFVPPVVAAVVVTAWLANGRSTITTLEEQSAVLRQRLAARSSTIMDDSAARPNAATNSQDSKKPIDWKQLAAQMQKMQNSGGMGDMRAMIRIQQRLQAMSRNEIVSALDEISALDLPTDSRNQLEQMLLGSLCQKDPEFALNHFADRLNSDNGFFGWQLSNAMQQWTSKDPAAATAWFDQQIAAGKFDSKSLDGKNRLRLGFEGNVIGALLSTDPSGAALRLQQLPEDQRKEVLENHAGDAVKPEDQLAFATLVRQELKEDDQLETIAKFADRQAWSEGFTKTDEFLDRIQATPAERAASVESVVSTKTRNFMREKKITREEIDSLRDWVGTQAPDAVDTSTGKSLASATFGDNGLKFSEAADLALQYQQTSGNDDVLVSFLERGISGDQKDEARALAEKISDPARREAILKRFQ